MVLVVAVVVVVAVAVAVVVVVKTLLKHDKPHQLKVGFHKGHVTKCLTNYNKHIINSNKVINSNLQTYHTHFQLFPISFDILLKTAILKLVAAFDNLQGR